MNYLKENIAGILIFILLTAVLSMLALCYTKQEVEKAMKAEEKKRELAAEMIADGTAVYLNGIEVSPENINMNAYNMMIEEECIILWN